MLDDDLEELLNRADPGAASAAAGLISRDLAITTRASVQQATPAGSKRRSRRHRPALVAGLAAATVALSGAGTLTAYQLGVPPFQTLDKGLQRVLTPIPLDYVRDSDGEPVRCSVFLEFREVRPAQLSRLEAGIANTDWSGERQRQLRGQPVGAPVPKTEAAAVPESLLPALYRYARSLVPELGLRDADGGRPSFEGYGYSCRINGGR